MNHSREILLSSVSVEWFTPSMYIEAARGVMGSIDLDPASCRAANERIRATKYFDQASDGLKQEWEGRVFCNPPYGRSGQTDWTKKAVGEYQKGNVTEAILLVNSATGNKWFSPLWAYPICFVSKRIKFVSANDVSKHSPTHSNVFAYLGPNEDRFIERFKQFGPVAKRID